jgi:hypothetical protein
LDAAARRQGLRSRGGSGGVFDGAFGSVCSSTSCASTARAEILPVYRLVTPAVCAMSEKVERAGIEPATFGLQSRRSPS